MARYQPGDLIKLSSSERKNGIFANKKALVVDRDRYNQWILLIDGELRKFHTSQIESEMYTAAQ
jgi:hypothetical protein